MMDRLLGEYVTGPMILSFLGAILVTIGAVWGAFRGNVEKVEASKKKAAFEQALREKTEEIVRLTRETRDVSTGGEVDFYVLPELPIGSSDSIRLMVGHWSDRPIYDLRVRVRDHNTALSFEEIAKSLPAGRLDAKALRVGEGEFDVGTVGPGVAPSVGEWRLAKDGSLRLSVWLSARNGGASQRLTLLRRGNSWFLATRASRDSDHGVILDSVDPGFPLDGDGRPIF